MKKLLLFLLISGFTFGQNTAKDTLLVNGTQPASILKINNNKIYIAQNKELQTSYKLEKDGSLVSAGVPYISVKVDKNPLKQNVSLFITKAFDQVKITDLESKEIVQSGDKSVFIKTSTKPQQKKQFMTALYPLSDRLITLDFAFDYKDEDDKSNKYYAVRDIIENGFMVLENYYTVHKQ